MSGTLHLCITCDRFAGADEATAEPSGDATPAEPSRGARLALAVERSLAAAGGGVQLLRVDCLDGCTRPCNAALSGRGKPLHRFSGLGPGDVADLVAVARHFAGDPAGDLPDLSTMPGLAAGHSTRFRRRLPHS
jgi:predicted metal-binding protein